MPQMLFDRSSRANNCSTTRDREARSDSRLVDAEPTQPVNAIDTVAATSVKRKALLDREALKFNSFGIRFRQ